MPVQSPYPHIEIPDKSLTDVIFECILERGDDTGLIDNSNEGKSLTFSQIYNQSRNCAGFLRKSGLRKGDVVGVCAPTCLEFPIAMFGIMACGAVVTPCNPAYSEGELLHQFEITKPKMVIAHEESITTIEKVQEQIAHLKNIFVIGQSEKYRTMHDMVKNEYNKDFPNNIEINIEEDLAFLPFSSGTTGLPKCVMLTHKNLTSMAIPYSTLAGYNKQDSCYMDRPMYHAGGCASIILSFLAGQCLIMEKEFDVDLMLKTIEKYKITHILAVPPIMIRLVQDDSEYDVSSVKEIACAGAALAPDILRRMAEKFNARIKPGYGMTEAMGITYHVGNESLFTSAGKVSPGTQVKIVDLDNGKELATNVDGEIVVQGPQVMKGYMGNPEATKQTITEDGWMHTGDIGHFDAEGMLYIVDRIKEVIKYKTFQVPPAELESLILKHPKVADVGVIGIPDTYAGELPKAFVVKKDDSLTKEEVDAFVKENLVEFKHLRGGVEFVGNIPKSPLGKIQRNELKKMAGLT